MPPVKDSAANIHEDATLNRYLKVVNDTVFCSICSVEVSNAQKWEINFFKNENIQKMKPLLKKAAIYKES